MTYYYKKHSFKDVKKGEDPQTLVGRMWWCFVSQSLRTVLISKTEQGSLLTETRYEVIYENKQQEFSEHPAINMNYFVVWILQVYVGMDLNPYS